MRALTPIIGVIAVIALAVGVAAYVIDRPKSYSGQISALRAQIATLKATSPAGAVQRLQADVASLRAQLQKYKTCIPQIQQEIGGLNIQQSTQGGYLTNAYIQNPAIISTDCQKTLNAGG